MFTSIFCKQFLFQTLGECLVGGTGLQRATSGDQGQDQLLSENGGPNEAKGIQPVYPLVK